MRATEHSLLICSGLTGQVGAIDWSSRKALSMPPHHGPEVLVHKDVLFVADRAGLLALDWLTGQRLYFRPAAFIEDGLVFTSWRSKSRIALNHAAEKSSDTCC